MVAIAQEARPRHLRLVTEGEVRGRGLARARVHGQAQRQAQAQRLDDFAMLRRRLTAVAVIVLLLVALGMALGRASGGGALVGTAGTAGTVGSGSGATIGAAQGDSGALLPIARRDYVVQPGDTLWRIARALQPEGDVRPLVQQLDQARDGAPLRVGERIMLP